MEHGGAFAPTVLERWRRRENVVPGAALVALAAAGWAYTVYAARDMAGMEMAVGFAPFILGWVAMMVAMMLPATLPLILLHRVFARKSLAWAGTAALLAGYVTVWAVAGLPVYAYGFLAGGETGAAVLPGVLLVAGGVYQFTNLKNVCHARCSSPLSFLMHRWRPGTAGALRLGVLHGLDCLGCCAGVMLGLVALGTMNLAWMLTAAVIIFVEKTLPGAHRLARPLGVAIILGGVALLGAALVGGTEPVETRPPAGEPVEEPMDMDSM